MLSSKFEQFVIFFAISRWTIVATKKKYNDASFITILIRSHHYRVLTIKINNFPSSLQNFWENVSIVQVVQNFLGSIVGIVIHVLNISINIKHVHVWIYLTLCTYRSETAFLKIYISLQNCESLTIEFHPVWSL